MSNWNAPSAVPAQSYPCGGCGARVEYTAGTSVLRCPYCGYEQPIAAPEREVREHSYSELAEMARRPASESGLHVYTCQKCGAGTESDALSEACQFCGAPLVVDPGAVAQMPPEAVLPFDLDRDGARDALRDWVQSRRFAPSRLKKVTEAESTKGTYVPHWTYDSDTESHYRGQRGEYYWVTETSTTTDSNGHQRTESRRVRHTRWHSVTGTVTRFFDDILVPGTTRLSADQLDGLTPWPLPEAVPYQPAYLAGYHTLRYDVEPETGLEVAKRQMALVIEGDCRQDIGGDEQRVSSVETRYFDVAYKLMLLPVWVAFYLYAGRSFQVLINGRTGKVTGQRPYSALKIFFAVAAVVLVVAAIVLLVLSKRHSG